MNEWLGFRAEGLEYFLWFMHALNVVGKDFFGHITGYFNYCEKNKILGREGHQRRGEFWLCSFGIYRSTPIIY